MLIQIALMPDESINGYLTRLARVNCISSLNRILEVLWDFVRVTPKTRPKPISMLAEMLETSVPLLLASHSLSSLERWSDESELGMWRLEHLELYGDSSKVKSCPICDRIQRIKHGFTWRVRQHQILGVELCYLHGCELTASQNEMTVVSHQAPFSEDFGCDSPQHDWSEERTFVGRFTGLCVGALAAWKHEEVDEVVLRAILHEKLGTAPSGSARALENNERVNLPSDDVLLELVKRSAPASWFERHFPYCSSGRAEWSHRTPLGRVELSYLAPLAMTAMTTSVTEAFSEFSSPGQQLLI